MILRPPTATAAEHTCAERTCPDRPFTTAITRAPGRGLLMLPTEASITSDDGPDSACAAGPRHQP